MLNFTAAAIPFRTWFRFQAWSIVVAFLLAVLLILGLALPAQAENYTKEALVNVDFSGKDLKDSEFTKANLFHSNLSHTDLRGVSFFAANLETADLTGADLRVATLDTARFTKANLTNANLEGAFAFNTIFDGAIIDGADFTDVDLRPDARKLLCNVAQGVNPTTGRATRDTLECDYL